MFNTTYTFHGKHADYMRMLSGTSEVLKGTGIMKYGYDILILAPIIGACYEKKSKKENPSGTPYTVRERQVIKKSSELRNVFNLVILAERERGLTPDEKVNKVFRSTKKEELEEELKLFESYMLGGIEWLYENLIAKGTGKKNYLDNIKNAIEKFTLDFALIDDELVKEEPSIMGNEII